MGGAVGRDLTAGKKLQAEKECIEAELEKLRRNKRWNADNMCRVAENRTIISPSDPIIPIDKPAKENAMIEDYAEFCETHSSLAETLISMGDLPIENCQDFLTQNGVLLTEHCETYMMLDCLE